MTLTTFRDDEPAEPVPPPADVIGSFEDWLLDIVTLDGVTTIVGFSIHRQSPIDKWVRHQGLSEEWARNNEVVRAYNWLVSRVLDVDKAIPAYQALALLNYLKTMFRYQPAL